MDTYEVIVVGTGFASTFFLETYLKRAAPNARVLVLERGKRDSHAWQLASRFTSSFKAERFFENSTPHKPWTISVGFGGCSNCWWACTPRLLPNDFRLRSLYGVGRDWPLSYDDLAPYYDAVEETMAVAGPTVTPFPRSRPYPQPPHQLSEPDKILQKAYPNFVFAMPSARPSVATSKRPACCGSSTCNLCPVDAKFTIQNEMASLYADPRVTLKLNAAVRTVVTSGGLATGVTYEDDAGKEHEVKGNLVVLGANAIGNAELLLRSGLVQGPVGQGLTEQIGVSACAYLKGLEGFQGGTSLTAQSYNYYDGPHRAERAACMIEHRNVPIFRAEYGRWKEVFRFKLIYEDLGEARNTVTLKPGDKARPVVTYLGVSRTRSAQSTARSRMPKPSWRRYRWRKFT